MTRLATGIIPFRPKTFRGKWVPPKALCLSAHHPPPGSADGPSWSAGFGRPSFGEMSISHKNITFTITCEHSDSPAAGQVIAQPPLFLLKLNPTCVANGQTIHLPRYYEYSSTVKQKLRLPRVNFTSFKFWLPARTILKTSNITNIDLGNLERIKNYDVSQLRTELNKVQKVRLSLNPWKWYEIFLLIIVIILASVVALYMAYKTKKIIFTKRGISLNLANNLNEQQTPSAPPIEIDIKQPEDTDNNKKDTNLLYPVVTG